MTTGPGDEGDELVDLLGDLVGSRIRFQGMPCLVADVILSPAMLILKPVDGQPEIQADAYGTPHRRGPRLIEVPVFSEDGITVNPELQLLRPDTS